MFNQIWSLIQTFGLAYQSTGYAKMWTGDYEGNLLPAGVYYYVIDKKNGAAFSLQSGWVFLVR